MALDDYGALIRSAQGILPDYGQEQQQQQLLDIKKQEAAIQLSQFQQAQKQRQQFQTDLGTVLTDPSAQNVSSLIMKHPEFADQLKGAWNLKDKAVQDADLTQMSEVYSAASSGNFPLAAKALRARIDADKASGHADPSDEAIATAFESGTPQEKKAALGMVGVHLAATTGADHFASTYGAVTKAEDDKGQVVGRAVGHYETDAQGNRQFKVDYRDPDSAQYRTVQTTDANGNPVEQIVRVGGDQGGPTPTGPQVARTHGYTPRQRDGGDNSDTAVDNKVAALSKAVGVDPDTPMNPQQFAVFTQALPATEGGPGTLSGQQNNPGAIKDGSFAKSQPGYAGAKNGYAVFNDPQSGMNAMHNLLANNYYSKGQQSIRDIIEGRPSAQKTAQSGSSGVVYSAPGRVAAGQTPPPPGNTELSGPAYIADLQKTNPSLANQVQGVLDTRLAYPPATARSSQAQLLRAAVLQADPSYDEQAYKRRQTTIQQYTPGHPGPGASMVSAATLINHMYDLAQAARNAPDHATALQNTVSGFWGRETNAPWLIKINEGAKFVSSELPKFLTGKAPTEGEIRDHAKSYDVSRGKEGLQTALSTDVDYLYGRYQPLLQAYKDNTGKELDLDKFAPGQATRAKAAALEYYRANGALPTVVTNPAQAAKLPHGSVFATPDGRILRRQ